MTQRVRDPEDIAQLDLLDSMLASGCPHGCVYPCPYSRALTKLMEMLNDPAD